MPDVPRTPSVLDAFQSVELTLDELIVRVRAKLGETDVIESNFRASQATIAANVDEDNFRRVMQANWAAELRKLLYAP